MVYLVPSLRDDCVIQRDHCRELLVFWCKVTAMIAKCVTSAAGNDGYVPFWCFQGLLTAKAFVVKYRPLPLEIHCINAKMGWNGDTVLISRKGALEKFHKDQEDVSLVISLGSWTFPLCASATTSNNSYIFRCRQGSSRPIVVLMVDNSFDGYSAMHACYRWIISAASTKSSNHEQQNPYLQCQQHLLDSLWIFIIGQLLSSRAPCSVHFYGCVTSATIYNYVCVFWCYQHLSSTQGSRQQATLLPLESGYQQSFIAWTSL
ncbi:predicted protein [Lichtheimia corymbifera JMRC:FSU:9682]|uniref:Uncharacterized protein n=1 Tax=Lichtheimia corymbifera JMRC:FSU:9682 TaxID=1263082 RepID=A0A068S853_9FUNG|nr:predicted protein [Lichtheimia corymbifera JMRC:FSU:9682]